MVVFFFLVNIRAIIFVYKKLNKVYNNKARDLQGRVKFPTGGILHELKAGTGEIPVAIVKSR